MFEAEEKLLGIGPEGGQDPAQALQAVKKRTQGCKIGQVGYWLHAQYISGVKNLKSIRLKSVRHIGIIRSYCSI